jgi:hypothetical protein
MDAASLRIEPAEAQWRDIPATHPHACVVPKSEQPMGAEETSMQSLGSFLLAFSFLGARGTRTVRAGGG